MSPVQSSPNEVKATEASSSSGSLIGVVKNAISEARTASLQGVTFKSERALDQCVHESAYVLKAAKLRGDLAECEKNSLVQGVMNYLSEKNSYLIVAGPYQHGWIDSEYESVPDIHYGGLMDMAKTYWSPDGYGRNGLSQVLALTGNGFKILNQYLNGIGSLETDREYKAAHLSPGTVVPWTQSRSTTRSSMLDTHMYRMTKIGADMGTIMEAVMNLALSIE